MTGAPDLAKMVPGFEFLQTLMKNAGAAIPGMPGMGQWIAPTLDPKELDKRIQELKTVQFWLEQNARLLATTIQALEVQRMTLSTLQTMNLPLTDLRDALKIGTPQTPATTATAAEPAPPPAQPLRDRARKGAAAKSAAAKPGSAAIDPLQWWGALTQQFTELASKAMTDSAAQAKASLPAPATDAGVHAADPAGRRAAAAAPRKRRGS